MLEYKTTFYEIESFDFECNCISDPIKPPGDGWRLISSTVSKSDYIMWFWEREKVEINDKSQDQISFDQAWKEKEKEGYQYGRDALEQVRFGWEIKEEAIKSTLKAQSSRINIILEKLDSDGAPGADLSPGNPLSKEAASLIRDLQKIINFSPELCPTCNEQYHGYEYSYCSDGFHCCRDCVMKDGLLIKPCSYHLLISSTQK